MGAGPGYGNLHRSWLTFRRRSRSLRCEIAQSIFASPSVFLPTDDDEASSFEVHKPSFLAWASTAIIKGRRLNVDDPNVPMATSTTRSQSWWLFSFICALEDYPLLPEGSNKPPTGAFVQGQQTMFAPEDPEKDGRVIRPPFGTIFIRPVRLLIPRAGRR